MVSTSLYASPYLCKEYVGSFEFVPSFGCVISLLCLDWAKDELAAEFLIGKVSDILTNERKGTWAEASHIERLTSEDLMENDHCLKVEQHIKLQQSIYKSQKRISQRQFSPPTE